MIIGLGGSCHWCTEAVFQSLNGVTKVEQGWIAALPPDEAFSEAVVVYFDHTVLCLHALLGVHLHTHSCTAAHSMRDKYRSAVYVSANETDSVAQTQACKGILIELQEGFSQPLVTRVLALHTFKPSAQRYRDYYKTDPTRPFCQHIIAPKLRKLQAKFPDLTNQPDPPANNRIGQA